MATCGKISRLPHPLREQLNLRLLDNEPPSDILAWLNSLPELQAILAAHFKGEPVSSANLSHYKLHGGYRDWVARREARDLILSLEDPQAAEDSALAKLTPELLSRWVRVHYAAQTQNLPDPETEPEAFFARLRQLGADLSRDRRDHCHQQRLELEEKRLALLQNQIAQNTEAAHLKWTELPEVRAWLYAGLAPDTMALVDRDRGFKPPPISSPPGPNPKGPNS